MKLRDIPVLKATDHSIQELLNRTDLIRAAWTDLIDSTGAYVVYVNAPDKISFASDSGAAIHATITPTALLETRWKLCQRKGTDILYIGKAQSIKKRIRQLIRFGAGLARNHVGGQSLWQVRPVKDLFIASFTCPSEREQGFENELLRRFHDDHGTYPVCNGIGPRGDGRWWPEVKKVISDGQTGVDRAGLDAAIKAGIPIGGYCPKGKLAEDGTIPEKYPMIELESVEPYYRTEQNVIHSDGTLILNKGPLSAGTKLTHEFTVKYGKPNLIVQLDGDQILDPVHVIRWIKGQYINTLNIAGTRESKSPEGIYDEAVSYLDKIFTLLKERAFNV